MLFFFHIHDGTSIIEDFDGTDLPDLTAARVEALASARDLLADRVRAGQVVDGQHFEITDESGAIVGKVMFKDALVLPADEQS